MDDLLLMMALSRKAVIAISSYSFFFFSSLSPLLRPADAGADALTVLRSMVPKITKENPNNQVEEKVSSHNKNPSMEETQKLAALASAVPAMDPLSSMPSKKLPTMKILSAKVPTKHKPRTNITTISQVLGTDERAAVVVVVVAAASHVCKVQAARKVSEEKANLARQDAAAPKAPLNRANGTDILSLFTEPIEAIFDGCWFNLE